MPSLTLTILGAGPAAPNVGGACSGYLVREGDTALLLDCGSGVAGRISQHVQPQRLHATTISHLHPDHYFDLVPLYYILKFGEPRPTEPAELAGRLPVYLPPGGRAFMRRLGELISDKPAMLEDVFELCEYSAAAEVHVGCLTLSYVRVQHYVPSHAVRIRGSNGATLVFSSDVGPCPELVDAARGADVLLCESALLDPAQDEPEPGRRGHMSAAEAGAAAHQAGAGHLVLTHFRSGPAYDEHHHSAASQAFGGPVDLAREGHTYTVG